jgi:EAL domain-containing protein (putative c-di-GMP-specific phosphodiesterase class I)
MGVRRVARFALSARHGLVIVFSLITFLLLGAAVIEARSVLTSSLYATADADAAREARLTADLGLVAALSSGRLSARDLRLAGTEFAVARRDSPLTGVVIRRPNGSVVFAAGTGRAVARGGGPAPDVDATIPLGPRVGNAVAVFHYSRTGIERDLAHATRHLYLAGGVAGVVMYLAILPLLAGLANRIPLAIDPARRSAIAELKAALARDELTVHYQPKIAIATGRVVGVEALVRWRHPERGLLSPGAFLPVAESSPQLLSELTERVLDLAASDCANWLRAGRELPVAVNVPGPFLLDESLAGIVREALDRYRLPSRMLTLELTEGALMEEGAEMSESLRELRTIGVSLSMDDFGTGYSSLLRLRVLPLDELKIDRLFIAGITRDDRDLGITRLVIDLGLKLGLRVVAEGVEDEATLELLRSLGCPVYQGFYATPPIPFSELCEWMSGRGVLSG